MPYINLNGQLIEVTQEQYDIYTIGQGVNPAAGGNVVQLNNTQTILTPNTTNNTPGQSTPTLQEQINAVARATGDDPSAPVSAEAQEIFNIGQRLNSNTVGTTNTPTLTEQINSVARAQSQDIDPADTISPGEEIVNDNQIQRSPTVPGNYETQFDELTGQYIVVETNSGQAVASGLTEQEAILFAQDQALDDEGISVAGAPNGGLVEFTQEGDVVRQPTEVSETALYGTPYDDSGILNPGWELDGNGDPYYRGYSQGKIWVNPNTAASAEASRTEALRNQARQQQTISQQRKQINNSDWRVRLRLAPQAKYLYNSPSPGIMQPLQVTDGIIFPYTPHIDTAYRANYSQYDLTHSNYRGYFYQNSYVDAINLRATFTAQDTAEANYLLAVITFLKAATKMFYGQESAERGSPPPLVYLTGLGEYQFNEHSCLIQQFNYNLPADIDYIRAGSALSNGNNLINQRDRQSTSLLNGAIGVATRLATSFLTKGAIPNPIAPAMLGVNRPTYVPTKMEISMTLLPVQSRQQVSKQFSVKNFANGNLIKGGFW